MNKLIKPIINFFKRLFFSAKVINIVIDTKKEDVSAIQEPAPEIQDIPRFTRENDLVNEFFYIPTPIHSSNLSKDEIVGYLQSNGEITTEQWDNKKLKKEAEELLANDVELLKDTHKPKEIKSTTAKL